jgi:hypothetical protein
MELTGKCKEDFEKWYLKGVHNEENYHRHVITSFYSKSESMQYGVYVDFFDSVGLTIELSPSNFCSVFYVYLNKNTVPATTCRTRPEARTQAIEKANEIYNLNQ